VLLSWRVYRIHGVVHLILLLSLSFGRFEDNSLPRALLSQSNICTNNKDEFPIGEKGGDIQESKPR